MYRSHANCAIRSRCSGRRRDANCSKVCKARYKASQPMMGGRHGAAGPVYVVVCCSREVVKHREVILNERVNQVSFKGLGSAYSKIFLPFSIFF